LLGFMGLYALLGMLFVLLVIREIAHGPEAATVEEQSSEPYTEPVRAQGGIR
jgi:cytochrome bd-type quinol oxidase subunit 1